MFKLRIKTAEFQIILKNVKLIIIDSLAALTRREFSEQDSKTSIERARFLVNLSARLKDIAHNLEISVRILKSLSEMQ